MYKLGLDEPSDYDINISSDLMFDRVKAVWEETRPPEPLRKDHGYAPKGLARASFPHVHEWANEWIARTGRDMSWALFDRYGPRDSSHLGFFVHFHDSDWIVRPPADGMAVQNGLARAVPDDTRSRDWSRAQCDAIVTADGQVTASETAKTRVIQAVADRMTTPLDRLLAAAAEPHVDPEIGRRLGSADHVVVLRNHAYPSMGGQLVHRDLLDAAYPADRLLALDDSKAPRIVREMAVSELITAWTYDPNGTNVRSLAIQEAAAAEFGLAEYIEWPMSPGLRSDVDAAVAAHGNVYQEFVRVQYDLTQAELHRRGANGLVLYQGHTWDPADVPGWATTPAGTVIDLPPQRPLSSWTGDRRIAEDWIGSLDRPGVIIAARFPPQAIMAYPQTGVGFLPQREFVVLAGRGRAVMEVVYSKGDERVEGD
jgi:hypothetical protein